jgi:hypothetical protein
MDAPHQYFWQRLPGWFNHLLIGSLCAVGVIMGLVGGLSLVAQSTADQVVPTPHFSVSMHAVAMAAVAGLTVAVTVGLIRLGQPLLAGVVLIGSVAGPMTLVAVPVRASLVDTSTWGDTRLWWHVVVAAVLVSVLTGWTSWVNKCLNQRPAGPPLPEKSIVRQVAQVAVFAAVAIVGYDVYYQLPLQSNEPIMRAIVGWSLLAAGIVVVAAFARTGWTSLALMTGVSATLGLVFLAYTRIGGWPGVAGWEFNGMQSPIITSLASTGTLLAAPLLGAIGWAMGAASRGIRAHPGTSAAEVRVG